MSRTVHEQANEDGPQAGEPPEEGRRRSRHPGRVVTVLALSGAVAVVTKPGLRARVLDLVFGPEEHFEYESVTEPVAPAIDPDAAVSPPSDDVSGDTAAETEPRGYGVPTLVPDEGADDDGADAHDTNYAPSHNGPASPSVDVASFASASILATEISRDDPAPAFATHAVSHTASVPPAAEEPTEPFTSATQADVSREEAAPAESPTVATSHDPHTASVPPPTADEPAEPFTEATQADVSHDEAAPAESPTFATSHDWHTASVSPPTAEEPAPPTAGEFRYPVYDAPVPSAAAFPPAEPSEPPPPVSERDTPAPWAIGDSSRSTPPVHDATPEPTAEPPTEGATAPAPEAAAVDAPPSPPEPEPQPPSSAHDAPDVPPAPAPEAAAAVDAPPSPPEPEPQPPSNVHDAPDTPPAAQAAPEEKRRGWWAPRRRGRDNPPEPPRWE